MGQHPAKRTNSRAGSDRGLTMAIQLPTKLRGAVVKWAEKQPDAPQIPAAVRRLVELGLAAEKAAANGSAKRDRNSTQQVRASEMAGQVIDDLMDGVATTEDKVYRKRRLMKGPDEFQKLRQDRRKSTQQHEARKPRTA